MDERPSKRRDRQMVRILGILGALLEGGQPTIRGLASKFGTRRETIYRDLRALEDAGYPITGDDAGLLSHPRILPEAHRHAPHLRLSDEEIAALIWASQQTAGKSPFPGALRTASDKLRAMAQKEQLAGIGASMIDGGWGIKDYAPHRETILHLVEAIFKRRRCGVEYKPPTAKAAKIYQYDPYRLLNVAGGLYCLGKMPPHENLTTLAVDRIHTLRVTDFEFEVDPTFDVERYQRESFGVIWEKPMNVKIRFSADQAPYVRERIWHPTQQIREHSDGSIELSFEAGGTFEIIRWILGWGAAAEVVSPSSLRCVLAETSTAMAALYVGASAPKSGAK